MTKGTAAKITKMFIYLNIIAFVLIILKYKAN